MHLQALRTCLQLRCQRASFNLTAKLLWLCSNPHNDISSAPLRYVSMAAVQGAVHLSAAGACAVLERTSCFMPSSEQLLLDF